MKDSQKLSTLVRRALDSLQTPFARLVFLAALRDSYTGRYLHEGWATVSSAEEVHRAAQEVHYATMKDVLRLPLAEFCRQLRDHFRSLGGVEQEMAKLWLEIEPFREMLPAGGSPLERELFLTQMKAALGVLVRCPDLVILHAQVASLRQPLDLPLRPPSGSQRIQ